MLSRELKQGERILLLLQEEYPGYHPLIGVAQIAHTTDDNRLKFDCHKTLAQFIEPTLKSVEVSQAPPDSERLKVIFENADPPPQLEDKSNDRLPVDEILDAEFHDVEHKDQLNVNVA